jgi:hypothetical protein
MTACPTFTFRKFLVQAICTNAPVSLAPNGIVPIAYFHGRILLLTFATYNSLIS